MFFCTVDDVPGLTFFPPVLTTTGTSVVYSQGKQDEVRVE